jgi:hypothetical protein
MNLSGHTRGRGSNPITGKRGTLGSRLTLNIPHKTNKRNLDLENLIENYKKYFGLIISKLYSSKPDPTPFLANPPNRSTLYKTIMRELYKKKNKEYKKEINKYNLGCKLNELIFHLFKTGYPLLTLQKVYPNYRVLETFWEVKPLDLITKEIPNPLKGDEEISEDDYFLKFSELKIAPKTLKILHDEYLVLNQKRMAATKRKTLF